MPITTGRQPWCTGSFIRVITGHLIIILTTQLDWKTTK